MCAVCGTGLEMGETLGEKNGRAHLADDLALHEDAHGHVEAEELTLHLQLQVVLRRLPLRRPP